MKLRITKSLITFIVGSILLVAGLIGTVPALYYQMRDSGPVESNTVLAAPTHTAATSVLPTTPLISGEPVSIAISSIGINLPVIDGYYNQKSGTWTLTPNKAQFATLSPLPNNHDGNTWIYGHALNAVFGHLNQIKAGDTAVITTSNGYKFTYKYTNSYTVVPSDSSLLNYKGAPILTLQTCSGAWYQYRQMFQFDFVGYSKI